MAFQANLQPLVDLGLTPIEAAVYACLVETSPATGYKVAKTIGKPTANVYKAIGSLEDKGAVMVEDSKTRLCRAVPADELLEILEQRFSAVKSAAIAELDKLKKAPDDQRVYHLTSGEQVFDRFRRMLESAQRVAMLDMFPFAIVRLRDDIARAARRGVKVTLRTYQPTKMNGVEIHQTPHSEMILEKWPGLWCNGVVDGREHIVAYLSADGNSVQRAIWSSSPLLALLYYDGYINELTVGLVENALEDGADITQIKRLMTRCRKRHQASASGYIPFEDDDELRL